MLAIRLPQLINHDSFYNLLATLPIHDDGDLDACIVRLSFLEVFFACLQIGGYLPKHSDPDFADLQVQVARLDRLSELLNFLFLLLSLALDEVRLNDFVVRDIIQNVQQEP